MFKVILCFLLIIFIVSLYCCFYVASKSDEELERWIENKLTDD